MSEHEQFAEDLALYALGTLSEDELFALEKHLEMCASCRRELEVMRGDLAVVALSTSGPKPPASFTRPFVGCDCEGASLACRAGGSRRANSRAAPAVLLVGCFGLGGGGCS